MTNHLKNETSAYLKQHANNPVHWYPWGDLAISIAREENKPILLSIGYSACHWCHVMAHESFANVETANIMNQYFINIKVDREERPDLDKIYQTAHHILTQQNGGWPLTVFLTPSDLTPFFSGTYFPPTPRYNLPAFKDVLETIHNIYKQHPEQIEKQNHEIRRLLQQKKLQSSHIILDRKPIDGANKKLDQAYDALHGGFGLAPKFPQSTRLEFLLNESSPLISHTLEQMANGGIYDQLAGGFFRYTVDAAWRIPHFEKMLYDNAQLLLVYAEASRRYGQPFFAKIAKKTGNWILENMQAPEGGYFSSINADSEGQEGKYYVWDKKEIESLLTPEEMKIIQIYYGLNQPPNFENVWHLYINESLDTIINQYKMPLSQVKQLIRSSKQKLLLARMKRVPPSCDRKILTAWNSLMIKAMLMTGDVLNDKRYTHSGQRALHFIYKNLWLNRRLYATFQHGTARFPGYLDDYAFLLDAILTDLQMNWSTDYLHFAIDVAETLLTHFTDNTVGGFYFTSIDTEKLLYRPKNMMDEALPSGNGIAAQALLKLGHLLGEERFILAAENTLKAAWALLIQFPAEHSSFLIALEWILDPPFFVILRGNDLEEMHEWRLICKKLVNLTVFLIPSNEPNLPEFLATYKSYDKTCAYFCKGNQCLAPILDRISLQNIINQHTKE